MDAIYRDGTAKDWPKIEKFLASTGYFGSVDCQTLGGHWMVAERDGQIVATIWCFKEGPHAFIDYFAGKGKTVAGLGIIAEKLLAAAGVRYVRATIRSTNPNALRLATEGFGMRTADHYNLMFKELTHGNAENDADSERTAGGEAGAGPDGAVAPLGSASAESDG